MRAYDQAHHVDDLLFEGNRARLALELELCLTLMALRADIRKDVGPWTFRRMKVWDYRVADVGPDVLIRVIMMQGVRGGLAPLVVEAPWTGHHIGRTLGSEAGWPPLRAMRVRRMGDGWSPGRTEGMGGCIIFKEPDLGPGPLLCSQPCIQ